MWIQIPDKFKTIATTVIGEIKKLDPRGLWTTKEKNPKDPTKTVTIMVKYGPTIKIENLDPDFSVQEDVIIEENIDSNTDDDHDEPMSIYDEYEQARKM